MKEKKTLRQLLVKYFAEILTIVIGVSISIAMNEWQNDRSNHQKGIELLEEIRHNLLQDSASFAQNVALIDASFERGAPLVTQANFDFTNDSLIFLVSIMPNFVPFQGTTVGYTHLEGSGGFALVKNKTLLKDIIDLYNNDYTLLQYFSDSENKYLHEQVIPFYNKNIPLFTSTSLADLGPKLGPFLLTIQSDEYRSIIRAQLQLKKQSSIYYQSTLKKIKQVIEAIEQETT